MLEHYTWILTLRDENELASFQYLKEELIDFLERRRIAPKYFSDELNEKSQMTITFYMEDVNFKHIFNDFIGFEMFGFRTTSLYIHRENTWKKLWKRGRFFIV